MQLAALRLGDAMVVKHGFAFKGEYFSAAGQHIVLTPGNFVDAGGFKNKSGVEKYYAGPLPPEYVLRKGDVVIAMTEQAVGLLGSSATIPADDVYLHNQRIGLVHITDPALLDARFVYHLLNSTEVRRQIQATATGSKVRHTAPARVQDVTVPVPDIESQARIASILDAFDDLIANNQRRIELLDAMMRTIYQEWFVHFRYPGHDADNLVESPTCRLPTGWALSDVGAEAVNSDRLRRPLSSTERLARQGPFLYYGAAKPLDCVDDYLFDGDYLLMAEDGSVVTSEGTPVLQRVRGRFWVSNHAHVLQGGSRVSTSYLQRVLEIWPISGHITGAAQPKVTQANLNRIAVVVPPRGVMDRFTAVTEPMSLAGFVLGDANLRLLEARRSLLPKLITGQIDVSDQSLRAKFEEVAE